MEKLRILCLHGYHGSAATLRAQMRAWTEGLEAFADFVHVDAPSLAERDFGWWHAAPPHYRGWARTRDWLVSLCAREKSRGAAFDGVFGFSQGAAVAALLVGLCALDFAIVVGGFMGSDAEHAAIYETMRAEGPPSLHIIGRSDGIVPPQASRALAACFRAPIVLEHQGGHVVAATPAVREGSRAFLAAMSRRKAERAAAPAPPSRLPLWGAAREHPSMRLVFPPGVAARPRPAMLVFRGGGYAYDSGSGGGAAEWAAQNGMVGIEVEYATRSTGEAYPRNYADAARAVRLVRAHAAEWGIDPARIGVMGFSAGGHLASLLSTQPTLYVDPDDDLAARVSARPDLVVLAYPLISFVDGYAPGAFVGSVESFFGRRDVDETTRRKFSNELHVTSGHPPVFVWTTQDDALVPYTHATGFAEACRRANVPVSLTVYPHGPHGMGLALDARTSVREWTTDLAAWLTSSWGAP
jgi:acetyl esterase/lipase